MIATILESIMQAGQTTVFIAIGMLGFVYLAISAIFGGLGHDVDGGHDMDGGHDVSIEGHDSEPTVSIFSVKVIAIFLVGFGGVGAIASQYDKSIAFSISAGLISGVVFGIIGLVMLRAMYRQQSNSSIDTNNAVGKFGQVTINIPQNGIGEVGVTVQGSYSTFSARTENGQPVMFGRRIKVKSNTGGQLVVEPV